MSIDPASYDVEAGPLGLGPCPFCGERGEYRVDTSRLSPTMKGPGAIVSITIRHWCPRTAGVVSAYREVRGRDMTSAVAGWNTGQGFTCREARRVEEDQPARLASEEPCGFPRGAEAWGVIRP